jgi:hypothetical protein
VTKDRESKDGSEYVFRSYNYLIVETPTKQEEEFAALKNKLAKKAKILY